MPDVCEARMREQEDSTSHEKKRISCRKTGKEDASTLSRGLTVRKDEISQNAQSPSWMQHRCPAETNGGRRHFLQNRLQPLQALEHAATEQLNARRACVGRSSKYHWMKRSSRVDDTNGIAERAVPRVKEGTSAVLLQSGLDENWWADSMKCYTSLRNVQDLLSDGKTPYERRFGKPFEGRIIPFGSLVEYYPISAKDLSRIHQFGKQVLPGLFLGYALYAGGIWKGDIVVADVEELETMDPNPSPRIFNAAECEKCIENQKSQRQESQWKNVSMALQGLPQRNLHHFIL